MGAVQGILSPFHILVWALARQWPGLVQSLPALGPRQKSF